jgi:hypothetical protein
MLSPRGVRPAAITDLMPVAGQVLIGGQEPGLKIGIEAVLKLHEVRVCVVNDAALSIGHLSFLPFGTTI